MRAFKELAAEIEQVQIRRSEAVSVQKECEDRLYELEKELISFMKTQKGWWMPDDRSNKCSINQK